MTGDSPGRVVVDLAEVREVINWLHRESQRLAEARSSLHPSVHFGRHSPCGDTDDAQRALLSALDAYAGTTDRHRHHIAALTMAFEQVMAQYETVDSDNSAHLRKPQQ